MRRPRSPSRVRTVALTGAIVVSSGLVLGGGLALTRQLASLMRPLTRSKPELTPPLASVATPPVVTPSEPSASPADAGTPAGVLRFLAIGGGYAPKGNEVSLEQDIELVQRTLPGPGRVLFAGGSASPTVRELDPAPRGDLVELALGELLLPHKNRSSHYRLPRFEADAATQPNVEAALSAALASGEAPLLVYIAAHGSIGSEPRNNTVALWGGGSLSVARLDQLHEQAPRPLRLVATSCYSGGFADLAFWHAAAHLGLRSTVPRCGLFAGTADRGTSGCDPNPDRRAQESYALHMAHALSGTRRDGTPLPLELADFDRDGTIGLLDAHTWASIEAKSIDVPTTTSERWLEKHAPSGGAAIDPRLLPEDMAIVERLGAALGLSDERAARSRWDALGDELSKLNDPIHPAEEELHEQTTQQTNALLERWPMLDDPFHPDFDVTLRENRGAIEQLLSRSPEAQARAALKERVRLLHEAVNRTSVEEARVYRVVRAYDNLRRAAALMKSGGAAARYYQTLLACERAAP